MPLPPVVIELPPKDVASEHAPALVAACSDAVEDGDCQLGEPAGGKSRAVAIVAWNEARQKCRIELGLRRGDETRWGTRELEFDPGDPMVERWRAVGLVIGTLVGRAEREAAAAAPREPTDAASAKPPPNAAPEVPNTDAARGDSRAASEGSREAASPAGAASAGDDRSRFRVAPFVVGGPALDDGTWRFGGELELGARPMASLPARVLFAARHRVRPTDANDVSVSFTSLRLGASWEQRVSEPFSVELGTGASYERVSATVDSPPPDSGHREALGFWATGLVAVRVARGVDVAAGLGLSLTTPTDILLSGRIVGRAPRISAEGQLGPRFSF